MERHRIGNVLLIFRAATHFYCISNDERAENARRQVWKESKGTDSFYPALLQDLNDLCDFWVVQRDATSRLDLDGLYRDTESLITILASTVDLPAALSGNVSQSKIEYLEDGTDGWLFNSLLPEQQTWLCNAVLLSAPARPLRRSIIAASRSATRSLRSLTELEYEEEVLGISDEWALAAAIRVCEPLSRLHDSLLQEWACACDEAQHTDLLASFGLPCQDHRQGPVCLLNFISDNSLSEPWRIVSVSVKDETIQELAAAETDLHDVLAQLEQQTGCLDGKLDYHESSQTWHLVDWQQEQNGTSRPVMVDLQHWISQEQPCPISKVKFQDRMALAITLSYAFLELGGSPWMPYEKYRLGIWLSMQNEPTPHLSRPFLSASLYPLAEDIEDDGEAFLISLANPEMPCLPALGKLILELIVGRAIPWKEVQKTMLEVEDLNPERMVCLEAIRSCIGYKDNTFKAGHIRGDERLRTEFLTRVVYKLNYVLTDGCKTSLEQLISQQNTVRNARSAQRSPQRSPRAVQQVAGAVDPGHCLHDHGAVEPVDQQAANKAVEFLGQLEIVNNFIEDCGTISGKVKVAILDTGTKLGRNAMQLYGARIKEYRTWIGSGSDIDGRALSEGQDHDGHGTHSTSAFLRASTSGADVYVAQVFESRDAGLSNNSPTTHQQNIANAIKYAVGTWKVDIISMSFGYEAEVPIIEQELKEADRAGILLFAAASNVGGNTMFARRWPAKRTNVMCMYACEGEGNWYDKNPTADPHEHNFAALGVSVPLHTIPDASGNSPEIYRSGTSISTPVAAAIAASVLETIQRMQGEYVEYKLGPFDKRIDAQACASNPKMAAQVQRKRQMIVDKVNKRYNTAIEKLKTARGMSAAFSLMAENRQGYEYIQPWKLLREHDIPIVLVTKVFEKLEEAHLLAKMA